MDVVGPLIGVHYSMKSKVEVMTRVLGGLFEDALLAYPTSAGLLRDFSRLSKCIADRGIRVCTLDLPTIDEFLLASLEAGELVGSGSFLTKGNGPRDRRPRFMHDLWAKIFDACGGLKKDADPNAILFIRQISCLCKKVALDCAPDRIQNAVKEFRSIEAGLRPPTLDWDGDELGDTRCWFYDGTVKNHRDQLSLLPESGDESTLLRELDIVCSILSAELGLFHEPRVDRFGHGPGAVADGTSRTYKFDFPHWPEKLERFFPFDWCGSHSISVTGRRPSLSEPPSRLIAVPKTAKAPRLIASEPIAHQWAQQWVKNEIVERMRTSRLGKFISIDNQVPSQEMVARASVDRSLATLDLSSASDRLTCYHVERLLGANRSLLELCHAVRTRWLVNTISPDREYLRLKKFAAMGSALTFPIQCIFFTAVALTACGANSARSIDKLIGKVRVFGDDIIVPNDRYDAVVALLTRLGLKVNVGKSFSHGHFRESCGKDAFRGYDVTPVKPKRLWCDCPSDYVSVIDASNNLHKAGFWRAARYVGALARFGSFKPVAVPLSGGLLGFESYSCDVPDAPTRYNRALQRHEILTTALRSRTKVVKSNTASHLLDFYTQARRQGASRVDAMGRIENPITVGRRERPSLVLATVWEDLSCCLRAQG